MFEDGGALPFRELEERSPSENLRLRAKKVFKIAVASNL